MHYGIRHLCLVAGSALLFAGLAIGGPIGFDPPSAFAAEKGKSESRGNKDKDGNSGKSASSRGHSGSGPSSSLASRGRNATSGPHALYESVKEEYGFRNFGEFSSYIKSWRSAWRDPQAYEATMGNLDSLPGRQYAYADAFIARQTALQAFTAVAPADLDPNSLPTLSEYNDALAVLGTLDAQTVVDAPVDTYTPEEVEAATTVLQYEEYAEWDTYQQAVAVADAAFLATLPGNPTVVDPDLRDLVDEVVVQVGLAGADAGLF